LSFSAAGAVLEAVSAGPALPLSAAWPEEVAAGPSVRTRENLAQHLNARREREAVRLDRLDQQIEEGAGLYVVEVELHLRDQFFVYKNARVGSRLGDFSAQRLGEPGRNEAAMTAIGRC
jgi:hypothetical protein